MCWSSPFAFVKGTHQDPSPVVPLPEFTSETVPSTRPDLPTSTYSIIYTSFCNGSMCFLKVLISHCVFQMSTTMSHLSSAGPSVLSVAAVNTR